MSADAYRQPEALPALPSFEEGMFRECPVCDAQMLVESIRSGSIADNALVKTGNVSSLSKVRPPVVFNSGHSFLALLFGECSMRYPHAHQKCTQCGYERTWKVP